MTKLSAIWDTALHGWGNDSRMQSNSVLVEINLE